MYSSILDRLNSQTDSIAEIIKPLSAEELSVEPPPGKWSVKSNIAHIGCYQELFTKRIRMMIQGGEHIFEPYVPENDPGFSVWRDMDITALLSRLTKERRELYHLISSLTAQDGKGGAIHKKYGYMNITEWCEFFLLHEAHHIFTVFKLTRR